MKFHIYQDLGNMWRWKLVSRNGKIVAVSGEGYTRKAHAFKMVYSITRKIEQGLWDTSVTEEE